MKKKLLFIVLTLILCVGLVACGDDTDSGEAAESKLTIMDCVDDMSVAAVEEGVIYWDIYFNEQFNGSEFENSGYDYVDLLKECLSREENAADDVVGYWIMGYDTSDMTRLSWGLQDYETIVMYDENGSAFTGSNFPLIDTEVQEIMNAVPEK